MNSEGADCESGDVRQIVMQSYGPFRDFSEKLTEIVVVT